MELRVFLENLSSIGPEIDFLKSNKVLEKNNWMHCTYFRLDKNIRNFFQSCHLSSPSVSCDHSAAKVWSPSSSFHFSLLLFSFTNLVPFYVHIGTLPFYLSLSLPLSLSLSLSLSPSAYPLPALLIVLRSHLAKRQYICQKDMEGRRTKLRKMHLDGSMS